MDVDTAKSIEALVRMIDTVNSTKQIAGLGSEVAIVLACSARRRGVLSSLEEDTIQTLINDFGDRIEGEPYPFAKASMETVRKLWEASRPT